MHCQWQFSIANCYFTRGYIMVIVIIHEQVVSVNPPHDFGSTAILFYKLSTKNKHWSQPFHLPIQEGTTSISIPKCMICLHVCICPVCPACPVCFVRLFVCLCLYLFMSTYIYIYIYTYWCQNMKLSSFLLLTIATGKKLYMKCMLQTSGLRDNWLPYQPPEELLPRRRLVAIKHTTFGYRTRQNSRNW